MAIKRELISWIKVILIAVVIALLIRTFLFTPIIVDGASMLPTLHSEDQMLINKVNYLFDEPERFDIVVFHASKKSDYIKRVIGLPGEHIAYQNEKLYVNGEYIREPFLEQRLKTLQAHSHYTRDFTLEELPGNYKTIPEGFVLVLGDNRTNSTDSRMIGLVSIDQIIGKAQFIFWPFKRFGTAQ